MTEARRHRTRFVVLVAAMAVALLAALAGIVVPTLSGRGGADTLPTGDAKRVADLDRLAEALDRYHARHGGYPVSSGSCADGRFDSDAEIAFLHDLEREGAIEAVPRDPDGVTATADDCRAMYGAKHYLYYSNGTKFALVASVDDPDAVPDDAAGVHLADGDRAWFDGSALVDDWGWSRNVYVVSAPALTEVRG
ncbi:hypothetical protein [Cellulomonas triticagri]|uniref:Type II secretion system protein GspG C-terminal domain-containing protein n=1 Tax=Cellulomonas triticagri TaxID=2483352 RepID=A0A3M2J5T2_9CELL|nr:hypothetical protein [Cellulomonas triticagri]RMI08769.1 hypothetical protein EBM89_13170 [Cellulomonas triticagri]